jgi:hypothetical protein
MPPGRMDHADRQKWKSEIKRMTKRRTNLTILNTGKKFLTETTWSGLTLRHRRPPRRDVTAYDAAILSRAKGIIPVRGVRRLIKDKANLGIL